MGPAVEFRVQQCQFASGSKSFASADAIDRACGQASAAAYAALDVLMKIFLRHWVLFVGRIAGWWKNFSGVKDALGIKGGLDSFHKR